MGESIMDELKLSDFIEKITNMYLHNLEHYPDEKPTIDGAFREVLQQIWEEQYNEQK
tara:strand:+ start:451 stop:621 length:171 start_codon:yes stop_codon:yes gene_type:complete